MLQKNIAKNIGCMLENIEPPMNDQRAQIEPIKELPQKLKPELSELNWLILIIAKYAINQGRPKPIIPIMLSQKL